MSALDFITLPTVIMTPKYLEPKWIGALELRCRTHIHSQDSEYRLAFDLPSSLISQTPTIWTYLTMTYGFILRRAYPTVPIALATTVTLHSELWLCSFSWANYTYHEHRLHVIAYQDPLTTHLCDLDSETSRSHQQLSSKRPDI